MHTGHLENKAPRVHWRAGLSCKQLHLVRVVLWGELQVVDERYQQRSQVRSHRLHHRHSFRLVRAQRKSVQHLQQDGKQPFHSDLLQFQRDSWVQIKQADGRILLSQMNRGGTEQQLDGRPPFDVVIGNAPAVRLVYKGQPFDLKPHYKVDVARLVLE